MLARMGRILSLSAVITGALGLTSCRALDRTLAREPTSTPDPLQILDTVRREVIPAEGSPTAYGPRFTSEGYEILREWNGGIHPEPAWADDYERLDIQLPCCGATYPFEDETKNCGCGHHQAMYGLAKRLLRNGTHPTAVQDEIIRWRAYLFPRETLEAELERRSLGDPAMRQALDELRRQGVC